MAPIVGIVVACAVNGVVVSDLHVVYQDSGCVGNVVEQRVVFPNLAHAIAVA